MGAFEKTCHITREKENRGAQHYGQQSNFFVFGTSSTSGSHDLYRFSKDKVHTNKRNMIDVPEKRANEIVNKM